MKKIVEEILFFLKGVFFYYDANRFIIEHRLWRYLIFPGILGIFYMLLLSLTGIFFFPDLADILNQYVTLTFISKNVSFAIILIMLWIVLLGISYVSYQQIILIGFSPILGHISNVTEQIKINEQKPSFSIIESIKDGFRSSLFNIKNIIRMAFFGAIAAMTLFLPIVGLISVPVLIFLILSYYGGSGLVDFTLERKQYTMKESSRFNRENRALTTGVGFGFCLILLIPFLGWMVAPGYGTVAATLAAMETIE